MLVSGGSFVTLVQPGGKNVTVVLEKLEGRCLRCAGQTTTTETVSIKLSPALAAIATKLQVWLTNETIQFVRLADVHPVNGVIDVTVPKDSIVTVSTWFTGQSKATVTIPKDEPFPSSLTEDFQSYPIDGLAKYFADNGGSFQVAADPHDPTNMVYKQWVRAENGVNRWGRNVPPVSLLGNTTWASATATVSVKFDSSTPPPAPTPAPTPPTPYSNFQNQYNGLCLDARGKGTADGTQVDVWTCESASNEAFNLNNETHEFVESHGTGKCISDNQCAAGTGVCLEECATATKWALGPDNTIVKIGTTQCLQASSKQLDGNVVVAPCNTPATPQEQWKSTKNPTPAPDLDLHVGLCVHADRSGGGTCLMMNNTGSWTLTDQGKAVSSGTVKKDVYTEWTSLQISATGTAAAAVVDGHASPQTNLGAARAGMVSINSNYNVVYFDNFTLTNAD